MGKPTRLFQQPETSLTPSFLRFYTIDWSYMSIHFRSMFTCGPLERQLYSLNPAEFIGWNAEVHGKSKQQATIHFEKLDFSSITVEGKRILLIFSEVVQFLRRHKETSLDHNEREQR